MLYDQAQYISLNRLNCSASLFAGFLIKPMDIRQGTSPSMMNRITPGIKKSEKGECSKIDKGKPPIIFPDGEMINKKPPPMALRPRNNNKEISIFRNVLCCISIYLGQFLQNSQAVLLCPFILIL